MPAVNTYSKERVSSAAVRPELEAAIDFAREGDTFVVAKLDRLARSVAHLVEIAIRLQTKKVALRILGMGIDTSTAIGRMMFNIIGSIAQCRWLNHAAIQIEASRRVWAPPRVLPQPL